MGVCQVWMLITPTECNWIARKYAILFWNNYWRSFFLHSSIIPLQCLTREGCIFSRIFRNGYLKWTWAPNTITTFSPFCICVKFFYGSETINQWKCWWWSWRWWWWWCKHRVYDDSTDDNDDENDERFTVVLVNGLNWKFSNCKMRILG